MDGVFAFLRENAVWLVGSGGLLGALMLLLTRSKGAPSSPRTVGRDNREGSHDISIRQGSGPVAFGFAMALVLVAVGGVMMVLPRGEAPAPSGSPVQIGGSVNTGAGGNAVIGASGSVNIGTSPVQPAPAPAPPSSAEGGGQ